MKSRPVTENPPPPDTALGAFGRVRTFAEKLVEAAARLDALGGIRAAASAGRWGPGEMDRAGEALLAASEAAEAMMGELEARRRHYPARRGRLG